jgi:hypothetical protein
MKRFLTAICAYAMVALSLTSPSARAVSNTPTASCGADCILTFSYTGDYYAWTVPAGVNSVVIDAQGAQGGKSSCSYNTVAAGGNGGRVQARLATTPGSTLYIYIGGQGSSATTSDMSTSPGWNGGGRGGVGNGSSGYQGSGGGGATDIRTSVGNLSSRILVSGGGGGASCNSNTTVDNGGVGGGLVAPEGPRIASGSNAPGGGTQLAGGIGSTWSGWGPSESGSLGLGGNAQVSPLISGQANISGGGGGGGGYYGGGGGSWVGGAGGSSFTHTTLATSVTHTQGSRAGNGLLTITYTPTLPAITISIAGDVKKVSKGSTIQLVANVDQAGKVTFTTNGKRITGCIGISTAGGNVTCNWKPTVQGTTSIVASIYQSGVLKSSSTAMNLGTVKRAGPRG